MISEARLKAHCEELNILSESQAGSRDGRSTVDNIYILNHFAHRDIVEGKKVYTLLEDFNAAFDKVNRRKLWKILQMFGIDESTVQAIEDIYKNAV